MRWRSILVVAACLSLPLYAQLRYTIHSQALELHFPQDFPSQYFSFLSPDKLQLTIILPGFHLEAMQQYVRHPILKEFIITSRADTSFIHIFFRKPAGYALAPRRYSQVLSVNVFQWDQLSQGEIFYYSGLLALESRLFAEAQQYFEAAGKLGEVRGYADAGLVALEQGKFAEALLNFAAAVQKQADVPDVFLALADLAAYYQRPSLATFFRAQYQQRTAQQKETTLLFALLDTLVPQPGEISLATQIAQRYTSGLLDSIARWVERQSAATKEIAQDHHSPTSAQKEQFRSAGGKEKRAISSHTTALPTLQPSWGMYAVFALTVALIGGMLGLGVVYLRWRKKQQERQQFRKLLQIASETEQHDSAEQRRETPATEAAVAGEHRKVQQEQAVGAQQTSKRPEEQVASDRSAKHAKRQPGIGGEVVAARNSQQGVATHLETLLQAVGQKELLQNTRLTVPSIERISDEILETTADSAYREAMEARRLGIPRGLLKWYRSFRKGRKREEAVQGAQ